MCEVVWCINEYAKPYALIGRTLYRHATHNRELKQRRFSGRGDVKNVMRRELFKLLNWRRQRSIFVKL